MPEDEESGDERPKERKNERDVFVSLSIRVPQGFGSDIYRRCLSLFSF